MFIDKRGHPGEQQVNPLAQLEIDFLNEFPSVVLVALLDALSTL